jgi:hypothetical protein
MRKPTTGHLIALFAMASLVPGRVLAQDVNVNVPQAPAEQSAAYKAAQTRGAAGLVAFLKQYPDSRLVPAVVRSLAAEIGSGPALQAALDAGVKTEVILLLVAELSPSLQQATANIAVATPAAGIY